MPQGCRPVTTSPLEAVEAGLAELDVAGRSPSLSSFYSPSGPSCASLTAPVDPTIHGNGVWYFFLLGAGTSYRS